VQDVLNIGVDPVCLLETLKCVSSPLVAVCLKTLPLRGSGSPDGVIVEAAEFQNAVLLDAMGHFSPLGQARQGQKPDGVCLVVAVVPKDFLKIILAICWCHSHPYRINASTSGKPSQHETSRTTYLFTYMDAHPERLSLEALFEDYLRLMPEYQGVELAQLQLQRALFGFPLVPASTAVALGRILPVGDSSGNQSPLSFGGFGAMVRHLKRLTADSRGALY